MPVILDYRGRCVALQRICAALFLVLICGLLGSNAISATATGNPTSCVNNTSIGTINWTNPTLAVASDNAYAQAIVDGNTSRYLYCTGYGFAIPAGAVIQGIVVNVERKSDRTSNGGSVDAAVRLIKAGTIGTSDRSAATIYTTADVIAAHGSISDLWGTTWTAADINAATFGVVFAATKPDSNGQAHVVDVDHIQVVITYSTGVGVPSVDHFSINIGGFTASTCVPKNITITAMDASNNVLTGYVGTVNITTSTAHGDWAKVTAAGTLTAGAADSGAASYQYVAADGGVAVLALSDDHADTALIVSVVDSLVPTSSTTSAPIAFGDNAFVLTNDTVQVAGRPQAMSVAMWRKDPVSGVCSISNRYTGARTLKAWYTRDTDDPGGAAPSITGMTSPPLGTAVPGSSNLTLTFAAGSANFNLFTVDVGKYAINLRDDSGVFGGGIIDGSSNTITTRPFALVVSAVKQGATSNPANTGPAGAVFARAGTNFQATVGAYRWNSAADANVALGDGVPDAGATLAQITANGAAPSYAWPTTVAGGAPYTPAGGTPSPWSNIQTGACPVAAPNCFASGIATPTNLGYNEVGSFTLSVAATGFLNTPGVDLNAANGTALVFDNTPARNGVVGRFIPDHFDTVVTAQGSPVGFAYSGNPAGPVPGQPFTVTVTAKNALATPTVTANYAASTGFSKDVNLSAPVGDGQLYVDAVAGGAGAVPAGSFLLGVGKSDQSVPADKKISFVFASLPHAEQAIQIHAEDADTVTSSGANGNINIRHGRLRVFNAFGSEKAALSLPLRAEYWSGNSWLINADDNFSVIPNTSVALSVVLPATLGTSATGTTLVGGQGSVVLAIPTAGGTGNTGSVDLAINLGTGAADQSCLFVHPGTTGAAIPWLRSINGNCAATYDRDPAARGSFGIYAPETRKTIHVRELF